MSTPVPVSHMELDGFERLGRCSRWFNRRSVHVSPDLHVELAVTWRSRRPSQDTVKETVAEECPLPTSESTKSGASSNVLFEILAAGQ